jgi:ribosomal protein S18 acetylase RimI-like enzyme
MLKISKAELNDINEILNVTKLAFSVYKDELSPDIDVKALKETEDNVKYDIENNTVIVAKRNGAILGCIRIKKLTGDLAYIYRFAVHPDANNNGIGSELLNQALEYCRKENYAAVALHTNAKYFKLARYYYGKLFYVHSTDNSKGYIRALFVKEFGDRAVDLTPAFKE